MNISGHEWEKMPFCGQSTTFFHSPVYLLGDWLRELKTRRDRTAAKTPHYNLNLVILACAFTEAALNRGLVNAAMYRFDQLPRTAENEEGRKVFDDHIASLVNGDIYGNPFPNPKPKKPGSMLTPYARLIEAILGVSLAQAIPEEPAKALRCLFLLRNIAIHGQTLSAIGVLPKHFADPVENYRPGSTEKVRELEEHLRQHQLLKPMMLAGGIGFPFLNDAVVDHFLRATVEFFRALQLAISDEKLRHEFGDGLPQDIFPILASEHHRP
jgi:hypothetical protein